MKCTLAIRVCTTTPKVSPTDARLGRMFITAVTGSRGEGSGADVAPFPTPTLSSALDRSDVQSMNRARSTRPETLTVGTSLLTIVILFAMYHRCNQHAPSPSEKGSGAISERKGAGAISEIRLLTPLRRESDSRRALTGEWSAIADLRGNNNDDHVVIAVSTPEYVWNHLRAPPRG